jgi:hypothetical protein
MDRISQSVAKRVLLKAFLAGTATPATGLTIAVVISKNGAAFGNPSAGSTNATEIASGWYYVDLSTTDTGTVGPLIVRGTEGTIDDSEIAFSVETPVLTKSVTLTEPSGPPSFPLTVETALAHAAYFSGMPINERVQYPDKQELKNQAGSVIAKKDIVLVSGVSITHEKIEAP